MFVTLVSSCDDCARQCEGYGRSCVAFECSSTDLFCAGFRSSDELFKSSYKDYQVCKKDLSGKKLLITDIFPMFFFIFQHQELYRYVKAKFAQI